MVPDGPCQEAVGHALTTIRTMTVQPNNAPKPADEGQDAAGTDQSEQQSTEQERTTTERTTERRPAR